MTNPRRPRFTHPVLLLRNALGRFVRLRMPKAIVAAQRTRRRRTILPECAQLVLF